MEFTVFPLSRKIANKATIKIYIMSDQTELYDTGSGQMAYQFQSIFVEMLESFIV